MSACFNLLNTILRRFEQSNNENDKKRNKKIFELILETIDENVSKNIENDIKKNCISNANNFFLSLYNQIKVEKNTVYNEILFVILNFEFKSFKQIFPLTLIKDKMKWKNEEEAIFNIKFPESEEMLESMSIWKLLILKKHFSNAIIQEKINTNSFESINSASNIIFETFSLKKCQVNFLIGYMFLFIEAEKNLNLLQRSKFEGFLLMSINKIVNEYKKRPELYFETIISFLNQIGNMLKKTFYKEIIKQLYFKISLIFFRFLSDVLLINSQNSPIKNNIKEIEIFTEILLYNLINLYQFDVFFSDESAFLSSNLCQFTSDLIFFVLEEYNLMISLPSIDVELTREPDSKTKKSLMFRRDNRLEFFTYLIYLKKFAKMMKSIDLNIYLQNQICSNFKLKFVASHLFLHKIENGPSYLKVG